MRFPVTIIVSTFSPPTSPVVVVVVSVVTSLRAPSVVVSTLRTLPIHTAVIIGLPPRPLPRLFLEIPFRVALIEDRLRAVSAAVSGHRARLVVGYIATAHIRL